jgi:protease IV
MNPTIGNLFHNLRAEIANGLAALPGERPAWLVMEMSGAYPMRTPRRKLTGFPPPLGPLPESVESFARKLSALARAPWLRGVVLRSEGLEVSLATAYSLREAVIAFRRSNKSVVCLTSGLDMASYLFASAADEIIAPESAEFRISGLAFGVLFMRDALGRFGIHFEKMAIREYKNAMDGFVRQEMSEAQREQYEALLDSLQESFTGAVADSRGVTSERVKAWIDEGVTSSARALALGMIDRIAYEDEALTKEHKPFHAGARFLGARIRPLSEGRVAVISLQGAIVPGKSRRMPFPLPLLGAQLAGAETITRAFRQAEADESTAAIVFYVDSGGGSALASDLIWREVARIRAKKPVVAVMGEVAASGGYYVLAHASRIIATPMTITGSIGVVSGKAVLAGFNRKYGLNPETVSRGRYALTYSSDRPFDDEERALLERYNREVYDRFTQRVAEGRNLSVARVDELGRGRVWSGADALEHGLVDELGDVALGIRRARELAGLSEAAAVWNVEAPAKMLLPTPENAEALLKLFRRERLWLMHPALIRLE